MNRVMGLLVYIAFFLNSFCLIVKGFAWKSLAWTILFWITLGVNLICTLYFLSKRISLLEVLRSRFKSWDE